MNGFKCKLEKSVFPLFLIIILFFSCSKMNTQNNKFTPKDAPLPGSIDEGTSTTELPDLAEAIARFSGVAAPVEPDRDASPDRDAFIEDFWRWIFGEARIPERLARKVASSALESPAFVMELLVLLQEDPFTFRLVDKQHALPDGYEPDDLVPLKAGAYRLGRDGLLLRKIASEALQEMAAAAAKDGIVLTVGSTYRSAEYQAQVYENEVKNYGQEAADRESAQPGKSQHQLGLIVDFSPIDDSFAETPASQWLLRNAGRYGWSLSYPDGYEEVTGYRWESWHYRYVGKDLVFFIDTYFEGIQQYALQFIQAWLDQAG